jgi:UDP-N-acetylmuramoyl-tripeptide--D-alanyl-D-alanine ligase
MTHTPLAVLAQVPGARVVGDLPKVFTRVHSDTRSLQAGDCFVALQGERFDAHDFLPQLRGLGVDTAVACNGLAVLGLNGIEVDDTRQALGQWATLWRAELQLPLIAVTGSNGKTTVTQMVAAILSAAAGDAALATQGNFNNDIGVPLTLLRLRPEHRLAVVELGMNHPGEIAALAAMAQATVALVNNAQREHQEFMSSVEAVARENATVFGALPAGGVGVFPHDDAFAPLWRMLLQSAQPQAQAWTFSSTNVQANVYAHAAWHTDHWTLALHTPVGDANTTLHVAGAHNVHNALAAATCALAAGVSLAAVCAGLASFEAVNGRSRLMHLPLPHGRLALVDDSYNANPDSVLAAIAVLHSLPAPRWLVLGDMGEVGEQGLAFHQEVLSQALAAGTDRIDVTGEWMAQAVASLPSHPTLHHWSQADDLVAAAPGLVPGMASALVKGSRFMRMERVVQALQNTLSEGLPHVA